MIWIVQKVGSAAAHTPTADSSLPSLGSAVSFCSALDKMQTSKKKKIYKKKNNLHRRVDVEKLLLLNAALLTYKKLGS